MGDAAPAVAPVNLNADNNTKLSAYKLKLEAAQNAANGINSDANFDTDFKKLPLIVEYSPRVGGKSRHKNNKNNKNKKSRRKNQSKRQRK